MGHSASRDSRVPLVSPTLPGAEPNPTIGGPRSHPRSEPATAGPIGGAEDRFFAGRSSYRGIATVDVMHQRSAVPSARDHRGGRGRVPRLAAVERVDGRRFCRPIVPIRAPQRHLGGHKRTIRSRAHRSDGGRGGPGALDRNRAQLPPSTRHGRAGPQRGDHRHHRRRAEHPTLRCHVLSRDAGRTSSASACSSATSRSANRHSRPEAT